MYVCMYVCMYVYLWPAANPGLNSPPPVFETASNQNWKLWRPGNMISVSVCKYVCICYSLKPGCTEEKDVWFVWKGRWESYRFTVTSCRHPASLSVQTPGVSFHWGGGAVSGNTPEQSGLWDPLQSYFLHQPNQQTLLTSTAVAASTKIVFNFKEHLLRCIIIFGCCVFIVTCNCLFAK